MSKASVADFVNSETGQVNESMDHMGFFLPDAELLEGTTTGENESLCGGKA